MKQIRSIVFFYLVILLPLFYTSCKSKKIITDVSKSKASSSGTIKERYAYLLNVKEKEIENEKLYRFIDSWIGVPYRIGGMDKKGVDCSGFIFLLEKEVFNKDLPRTARTMAEKIKRKYEQDLEEGDLVFFDFDGQKFSHVGFYLHNNKFVHASTSVGVTISDLNETYWKNRLVKIGRIPIL